MDTVSAIKARLPIEELVGGYCALTRKGRNFVCLCPFHNDTKPSFLVSPDKGIAYCFACQTGGDVFSFYQAIEGVDFPQALKELAERTGVEMEQRTASAAPKKDEKQRARECLSSALSFYRQQLKAQPQVLEYLAKRAVPFEQIESFEIGVAPDSFSATYEHLLKQNFSRKEILAAGLGVQKEMHEERIYDRFRNRLMFPIHDAQGAIVGFGGRTLGSDDAKYVNSSDGILFHKGNVLYGLHRAKDAMREKKAALLVEGYFDVLACHRAGATHAVATCGTALTDEHVKLLRRYVDKVILCMDQDRAGQDAMERSFPLLSAQGLDVDVIVLPGKDPSEILEQDAGLLQNLLETAASPYLDVMIDGMRSLNLDSPSIRREALHRALRLVNAIPSPVQRMASLEKLEAAFRIPKTEIALELQQIISAPGMTRKKPEPGRAISVPSFTAAELVLGMFLLYPKLTSFLPELIEPMDAFAKALFLSVRDNAELPPEHKERASVLQLFCEESGFAEWSESLATREIRKNIKAANKEMFKQKLQDVTKRLLEARKSGSKTDEAHLNQEYKTVLELAKKSA
jgi:DNA primase